MAAATVFYLYDLGQHNCEEIVQELREEVASYFPHARILRGKVDLEEYDPTDDLMDYLNKVGKKCGHSYIMEEGHIYGIKGSVEEWEKGNFVIA